MNPPTADPLSHVPASSADLPTRVGEYPNVPTPSGLVVDVEELRYDPVPSRKSATVLVRYRFRGRGQPLPYDLETEADE